MVKKNYNCPSVLEAVDVMICTDFLTGSVADSTTVETTGQENAGFYDTDPDPLTGSTFNHDWSI